jgi:tetratricopeptide (TPR) repeat protein
MKALEKDRRRRYETANGFAADVMRYLTDQPVEACPPSASYRLGKFVRRNKGPVAAGSALAALLVLGTVGTSIGLVWALQAERKATMAVERARSAEGLATDRLVQVTKENERATAAEKQAKEEAAVAQAVVDFLTGDLLAEASPEKNPRDRQVTVEAVLNKAAARITGKFEGQPLVEAVIRHTIGDTYAALGLYTAAQPHLERAVELSRRELGSEHHNTLGAMRRLAELYSKRGWKKTAEPLLTQVLDVESRVHGPEHQHRLSAMHNLAIVYIDTGQYEKAESLLTQVLQTERHVLGPDHPNVLATIDALASLYLERSQYEKAESLHKQVLEIERSVLGPEHPDTLTTMCNLAEVYRASGQYEKAKPLYTQVLEARRPSLGPEHPDTLGAMHGLERCLLAQGKGAEAEPLLVRHVEILRRNADVEDWWLPYALYLLSRSLILQGKYAEAGPLARESVTIYRKKYPDDWCRYATEVVLGASLLGLSKYAEVEPLLLSGYAGMKAHDSMWNAPGKADLLQPWELVVRLYESCGQPEKAAAWRVKLGLADLPADVFARP